MTPIERTPETISVDTAWTEHLAGRVLFVDARRKSAYDRSQHRLPEAIRVDPEGGETLDAVLRSLPHGGPGFRLAVVYCDDPTQESSTAVARRVRALGLPDACVLEGGMPAWRERRLPLDSTAAAAPLDIGSAG